MLRQFALKLMVAISSAGHQSCQYGVLKLNKPQEFLELDHFGPAVFCLLWITGATFTRFCFCIKRCARVCSFI